MITQCSKTDFGRFIGVRRVGERGLGVILCTYIPILRRRSVEGTSLEDAFHSSKVKKEQYTIHNNESLIKKFDNNYTYILRSIDLFIFLYPLRRLYPLD